MFWLKLLLMVLNISIIKSGDPATFLSPDDPFQNRQRFLSELPGSLAINKLALIGTHDSASSKNFPFAQTQVLSIKRQLESGIRVLDLRVRITDNRFALHHGPIFLNLMFGDAILQVNNFLYNNPDEFVIVLLQEEYRRRNSSLNPCQVLRNYIDDLGLLAVMDWSIWDNIDYHRGQILLTTTGTGFQSCLTPLSPCEVQNTWKIDSLLQKRQLIRENQDKMFRKNVYSPCYINYLSGNNPWELITPAHVATGVNFMMRNYFRNPHNTLVIILADFPGQELIDTVNYSNLVNETVPSAPNQKTDLSVGTILEYLFTSIVTH
ncbi:1-phosphatidylinositol phosphodiesterase-like [Microplitis mediator]|uniref:1-phosphatidylinositol phosphodiesterase-like n=1 Tax=Microplitis mediator TaxID=375433 RepID=UPI0025570490|nr:1-phosphatidylinositol phosphodiesterase-like [Microplitis mediator]